MTDPGVPKPLRVPTFSRPKIKVPRRVIVIAGVIVAIVLLSYGCSAALSNSGAGAVSACTDLARSSLAGPDDFTEETFTKDNGGSMFVKGRVGTYSAGTPVILKYWECTATKSGSGWNAAITFSSNAAG